MQKLNLTQTATDWSKLASIVYVPRTKEEFDTLVLALNQIGLEVGSDETHPLASLQDVIGSLIDQYENEHPNECLPDFARTTTEKVADQ
jgi:hypothetical protein